MASDSHFIDTASDKNCEVPCPLELGSGEKFKINLMQQQSVKGVKCHITPQLFTNPTSQALYQKIMNDVMYKMFDHPDEQKIFRAALEGMHRNYPEILSGQEKNMFYCHNIIRIN